MVAPRDESFELLDDDYDWQIAKSFVEIVEHAMCQLKHRFLETQSTQEIFCSLYKRSLSMRHPISQLMLYHCQGTIPVGSLVASTLLGENGYMHKLFEIGHTGSIEIVYKCYLQHHYDASDFESQLKVRTFVSLMY